MERRIRKNFLRIFPHAFNFFRTRWGVFWGPICLSLPGDMYVCMVVLFTTTVYTILIFPEQVSNGVDWMSMRGESEIVRARIIIIIKTRVFEKRYLQIKMNDVREYVNGQSKVSFVKLWVPYLAKSRSLLNSIFKNFNAPHLLTNRPSESKKKYWMEKKIDNAIDYRLLF